MRSNCREKQRKMGKRESKKGQKKREKRGGQSSRPVTAETCRWSAIGSDWHRSVSQLSTGSPTIGPWPPSPNQRKIQWAIPAAIWLYRGDNLAPAGLKDKKKNVPGALTCAGPGKRRLIDIETEVPREACGTAGVSLFLGLRLCSLGIGVKFGLVLFCAALLCGPALVH